MDGIFEIGALKGGAFGHEVSTKLMAMLQAVGEAGKDGSIVITIKAKRASGGMVALHPDCKVKVPEKKEDPDMRWVTEDGALTLQNPKQRSLELRPVGDERPQVRGTGS
jgi:hypothetical protein